MAALSATRLAAARKGQYVPTPLEVVDLIASSIFVQRSDPFILDPSCGEGTAVARLASRLGGTAWGNELEKNRYERAKETLYDATLGPQESLKVRNEFDILFINPPYDLAAPGKRYEVEHVYQALHWLAKDGVVVAIVPQHILTRDDWWRMWLGWVNHTQVYSFPKGLFGQFKQHVVFGRKRHRRDLYIRGVSTMSDRYKIEPAPPLTGAEIVTLNALPHWHREHRRQPSIENTLPTASELFADLEEMPSVLETPEFQALTVPPEHAGGGNPAMLIQATHVVQLAAAGMLNGEKMVIDGVEYLVSGAAIKYEDTVTQEEDVGEKVKTTTVTTEKSAYQIMGVSMDTGQFFKVDSRDRDAYEAFIQGHVRALIDTANAANPPQYDMDYSQWIPWFDRIHAPRKLPGRDENGLLTAQKHVVAALLNVFQWSKSAIIDGEMGVGKGQRLTDPILTPAGWKKMGDIRVGDRVIAVDGQPTQVTGVFPLGVRDVYKVSFSDGSSMTCTEDHLWEVNTPIRKWRGNPPRVMSLKQIMEKGLAHANGNLQHFIPMVQPVQFETQPVPLNAYALGVLLGDGALTNGAIWCKPDQEIADEVSALISNDKSVSEMNTGHDRCPAFRINGARPALRELGLEDKRSHERFVPDCYKFNTTDVRLAVLQGLLDTDGCAAGSATVEYCSTSRQLADDVVFLTQSLGGAARITLKKDPRYWYDGEWRTGRTAYRVWVRLPAGVKPFRLTRKAEKYVERTKYAPTRAIKKIELVDRAECQCIAVDHPRQLYVTENFVVTHNTMCSLSAMAIESGMLDGKPAKLVVMCPAVVAPKWAEESRRILREVPNLKVRLIGQERKQTDAVPLHGKTPRRIFAPDYQPPLIHESRRGSRVKCKKPILDAKELMEHDGPAILIVTYQIAKNGAPWDHAVVKRTKHMEWVEIYEEEDEYTGRKTQHTVKRSGKVPVYSCPTCGEDLLDAETGKPWDTENELIPIDHPSSRKRAKRVAHKCPHCGGALWQQLPFKYGGRFPVAEFVSQSYGNDFHLIVDEVHNTKGGDTDVGQASADLIFNARKTIAMTGTIFNGLARSLFYILYRTSKQFRQLYAHDEASEFVSHHGFLETVTSVTRKSTGYSGYGREKTYTREAPGATPAMVAMLMPITCFLTLDEIGVELPALNEYVVPIQTSSDMAKGLGGLKSLEESAKKALAASDGRNRKLHSQWFNAALGWLDHPVTEVVGDHTITGVDQEIRKSGELPKDKALLSLIYENLEEDRGVAVFFEQVNRRNAMPRVQHLLKERDIYSDILTVRIKPEDRIPWIRERVQRARRKGQEFVLLANGNLVKEGVDLIEFPTIIEVGQHYIINSLMQRLRRSWRLGQTTDVRLYFLFYERTLQQKAITRIAKKMRAAKQVDGKVAGGLAAYGGEDDFIQDLMRAADEYEGDKVAQLMQVRVVEDRDRPVKFSNNGKQEPKTVSVPRVVVEPVGDVVQLPLFG